MSSGYVDDAEQMPATAPANSVSNVFKLFLPSDSDRSHCMENRVRSLEREEKKKKRKRATCLFHALVGSKLNSRVRRDSYDVGAVSLEVTCGGGGGGGGTPKKV